MIFARSEVAIKIAIARGDLVHAPVKVVVIPNAIHFLYLDRPEHGKSQLLEEVVRFLQQN